MYLKRSTLDSCHKAVNSGLIFGNDRRMTTDMFIIPIDYDMTTQQERNAGDLPDCKEIKGDQWGSPFFHCVAVVLSFCNLFNVFVSLLQNYPNEY